MIFKEGSSLTIVNEGSFSKTIVFKDDLFFRFSSSFLKRNDRFFFKNGNNPSLIAFSFTKAIFISMILSTQNENKWNIYAQKHLRHLNVGFQATIFLYTSWNCSIFRIFLLTFMDCQNLLNLNFGPNWLNRFIEHKQTKQTNKQTNKTNKQKK